MNTKLSPEALDALSKWPGTTLEEKLFILHTRANDTERALALIVKAFDAPHRVKMLDAVVRARELLACAERMENE